MIKLNLYAIFISQLETLKPEIYKFLGYKQLSGLRNTNSITHAVQEYV